jgi:hypothetical protein
VSKLFNGVEPDVAVFGKKDYQQWRLICRMVIISSPFAVCEEALTLFLATPALK